MSTANGTIPHVIDIYLAARQRNRAELAAHMHMNPATLSKRMSGKSHFTADELDEIGKYLDVSPAMFFEDPYTLVRNRWFLEPALPLAS